MQYINKFKDKQTGEERLIRDASIVVNGETPATDELTKVKIRGVEYGLQDGTVEVNGSTEATETLKTLTVGDKTYYVDGVGFMTAYAQNGEINDLVCNASTVRDYAFSTQFDNRINIYGNVYLPNCTEIGSEAFFEQSSMTGLFAPKAEIIKYYAFRGAGSEMLSIVLPSVKTIEKMAFYESYMSTVDLGENIESIGDRAFGSVTNITTVVIRSKTVPTIYNEFVFDGAEITNGNGRLYVPDESIELYKADANVLAIVGNNVDNIKPLSEYVQS